MNAAQLVAGKPIYEVRRIMGWASIAGLEELERAGVQEIAHRRHVQHHTERPGGLRARRRERIERQQAGRCRHGVYVGGCGVDWMCGVCENGEHWESSPFSKSERAMLDKWEQEHPRPEFPVYYDAQGGEHAEF